MEWLRRTLANHPEMPSHWKPPFPPPQSPPPPSPRSRPEARIENALAKIIFELQEIRRALADMRSEQ